LPRAQIPIKSAEPGCAEFAPHRAADLAGQAARNPVLVGQQHALENLAIPAVDEELVNVVGGLPMGGDMERLNLESLGKLVAEGFRQVADLRQIILGSLVEVEGN